jgi:uncharacterized membrane protein
MPNLAALHPQVVHFVVALIVVGVLFRWLALAGRGTWLSPAALTLVVLGTAASLVAVRSGVDAHGPVERVPGARSAVVEHEEWGERARNAFLVLLVLEVVATTLAARQLGAARAAGAAAAVAGLISIGVLYKAGEAGGDLVYNYAGGVGIRSGDPADVNRLLIAAAHHQANLDRQQGRPEDAAAILANVADRFPDHLELQLARVDSLVSDRKDPSAALVRLDAIRIPTDDTRMRIRAGLLRSSALAASGDVTAARQVLETLKAEFPTNAQIQRRLAEIGQAGR